MAQQLAELERQRVTAMEQGLEQVIEEKMLELEAKERGISREELLESEVGGKLAPVTDGEVDAFYEARKDQIRQPKEAVAEQIRTYLSQQRGAQKRAELLESLKDKYEVATYLEPVRVEVAAAQHEAPSFGPDDAPVRVVEFSDFECPFCSRVVPTIEQIKETYGDKVRIEFRQFPLHSIHPNAQKAAEASLCAAEQGKFWEMHDAMFAQQRALGVEQLKEKAASLELDAEEFGQCLDSGRFAEAVTADLRAGSAAGVSGTPAFFINGRPLSGAQPFEAIAKIIDDELRRAGG